MGRRPRAPPPPAFAPPDGYELLGLIDRGGMGAVYKARDVRVNRLVAHKVMLAGRHAGPEHRARFRAEAEAVAALDHPGVVRLYEFGEWDGQPFFALEYCPGGTLASRLTGGPVPARDAARLVERLARAVAAAHAKGIVHRDIKPGNVLYAEDASPRIADFGLVKTEAADLTHTGAVLGTPAYMAPEQASGRTRHVGPPADVYALGVILYELLTGRPPFRGETALETIQLVQFGNPVRPSALAPGVPRDLDAVVLKCLEKNPPDRYPTAQGLADDLVRWVEGHPVLARRQTGFYRASRYLGRHRRLVATAAAMGLVAAAGYAAATDAGYALPGGEAARGLIDAGGWSVYRPAPTPHELRERATGLRAELFRTFTSSYPEHPGWSTDCKRSEAIAVSPDSVRPETVS